MKPRFTILALVAAAFFLGWFGYVAYIGDPHRSVQWQFAAAAGRGELAEVERCFSRGALIDACPVDHGRLVFDLPALLQAAGCGRARTVEWLLANGGNPNLTAWDTTPLDAAEHRLTEVRKTLDVLREHGERSLHPEPSDS